MFRRKPQLTFFFFADSLQKKKCMKILDQNTFSPDPSAKPLVSKQALILGQFFLIIFVYHILKDLKDTLVVTASEAGAEVLPFIKIWGMLPLAILASYLFSKLYHRLGREKTLYFFMTALLAFYIIFAFALYPLRQELYLGNLANFLKFALPIGCKGFISMVCYWIYTLFYVTAELWSLMILSVLFWGYVNEISTLKQAKHFYPLCMATGNCAGILSGQTSGFLCRTLIEHVSWQETLQVMILVVTTCGIGIMIINRVLAKYHPTKIESKLTKSDSPSFKESVLAIFQSPQLCCIALLVVGFGLTTNLIEVVWKESIKTIHSAPHAYNAYVNQLTSFIGFSAVCVSLVARRIFKILNWTKVAMLTPITLFTTSLIFFFSLQAPAESIKGISSYFNMEPAYVVMTLGSLYYVLAMTSKYTVFDMSKEMAFLSIETDKRIRAKSVIDSIGSRLGKSGASCLFQVLLITFGSTSGHIPIVGSIAILMIGVSIIATRKLGDYLSKGDGSYATQGA